MNQRSSVALSLLLPLPSPTRPAAARIICAALLATAVGACAGQAAPAVTAGAAPAAAVAATRGTLLIVGGGSQPPALVSRFVELAGGPGKARIAVLPMASSEAATGGAETADPRRALGARVIVLNLSHDQAQTDSVARLLDGITGVWFNGGDQARLTAALQDTRALAAIRQRYLAGAVLAGTSAGAAIMSDSMLTGDQVRAGEDSSGYFGDDYPRIARGSIVVTRGLGFLHDAIVDQHFLRRERHNRLLSVVLERPTLLGVGIDEGTALRVDPDGRWAVEGASAVIVYDARRAPITPSSAPVLGASDVRLHLLPAGSRFDPATGIAELPRT
ncbi:MAG: cyanophycinase [Gemmatimonadaceae bacterium]